MLHNHTVTLRDRETLKVRHITIAAASIDQALMQIGQAYRSNYEIMAIRRGCGHNWTTVKEGEAL